MADISFNRSRFLQVCYAISAEGHPRFNIGTYKEKKLHLVLKHYFEPLTACHEIPHAGYIADIRNADGIVEIQTSGFASMKGKLEAFLPDSAVTVVYPIAEKKWVTWIDPETGDIQPRHRSPKKGSPLDTIPEMIFILDHLKNPHLTLRAVMLEVEEYRMLDGKRSRSRKRGSSRYERMPLDIYFLLVAAALVAIVWGSIALLDWFLGHFDPMWMVFLAVSAMGLTGSMLVVGLFFALAAKNWPILGLEAVGMSLEDVFVKLMEADTKKKLAGERRSRT